MNSFGIEVWCKVSVALTVMATRFVLRLYFPGWRNFDATDAWCLLATALYTITNTCDFVLSLPEYPTNIALTPETAPQVPDDLVPLMVRGSKIAHFSWTIYICMIFAFKGVLLSLLMRVSSDITRQEKVIRYASIFTGLAAVASVLAHLLGCVPVQRVWQIHEFPGPYCTTRPQNYYVASCLNIVTDLIIIAIPMPMLWSLRIPLRRKVALGFLFSSGIFIIICTILRMYYSLSYSSDQALSEAWAGREGFVSMIVIFLPGIWPFISKLGWGGSSHKQSYISGATGAAVSSRRWPPSHSRTLPSEDPMHDDFEMGYRVRAKTEVLGDGDSEERIIGSTTPRKSDEARDGMPIRVTTEYSIQVEKGVRRPQPTPQEKRQSALMWTRD